MSRFFAHDTAAERYARWRPDVHDEFVRRLGPQCGIEPRVPLAVDVGCGTGQSSRALAAVVARVVGVDPAAGMLAEAAPHAAVAYVRAPAEQLPLRSGAAGLVTAALAFHWFDAPAFLAEAHRVLAPGGTVAVYDSWFTAELEGAPGFREWFTGEHLPRYPTPPRHRVPIDEELAAVHGFELGGATRFTQQVAMTLEQLAGYVTTQTNVIAAVEEGREEVEAVARWVRESAAPFFAGREPATFTFGGRIACLRRPGPS